MNKFIDHVSMISQNIRLCLQIDSSSESGAHWWSVLDIEPKTDIFFFDLFGVDGLKSFINKDGKKVIEEILFRTDQMKRTDDKITLVNI